MILTDCTSRVLMAITVKPLLNAAFYFTLLVLSFEYLELWAGETGLVPF